LFEPFGSADLVVVIRRSCVLRAFSGITSAFATTLLNGPQKSKEMKKEMASQELGKG
jgi:hypothetical protein